MLPAVEDAHLAVRSYLDSAIGWPCDGLHSWWPDCIIINSLNLMVVVTAGWLLCARWARNPTRTCLARTEGQEHSGHAPALGGRIHFKVQSAADFVPIGPSACP